MVVIAFCQRPIPVSGSRKNLFHAHRQQLRPAPCCASLGMDVNIYLASSQMRVLVAVPSMDRSALVVGICLRLGHSGVTTAHKKTSNERCGPRVPR